jgi:hypothetical protein
MSGSCLLTNSSQPCVLRYTEENETEYRGATLGQAAVDGTEVKMYLQKSKYKKRKSFIRDCKNIEMQNCKTIFLARYDGV